MERMMYFKSIKKINLEPYGLFVGKFEQRSPLKMSRWDIFFTLGFDSQSARPKKRTPVGVLILWSG